MRKDERREERRDEDGPKISRVVSATRCTSVPHHLLLSEGSEIR
jgi:hypothetical protein